MYGATPVDWATALLGARLCGRYRLTDQIGLGGMGAVFAGLEEATGREVAIKLLLPILADESVAMRRFEQEAQAAAQISRRGAVEIFDFDVDPEHGLFMVMERLRGQSLGHRLEVGALPLDEALFVAREVLDTLEEVHERDIVHRDLKPANIFLAESDGPRPFVKLLDFGISRVAASDRATKLTQTGVLLGTYRYMPPEQMRHASKVDHRADLYAVGAILSYALTGKPPYADFRGTAVLLALDQGPPRPVAELAPAIPTRVCALVDLAMAREPEARFQKAAAFRDAIDDVMVGDDRASPPSRLTAPSLDGRQTPETALQAQTSHPRKGRTLAVGIGIAIGLVVIVAISLGLLALVMLIGIPVTTVGRGVDAEMTAGAAAPGSPPAARSKSGHSGGLSPKAVSISIQVAAAREDIQRGENAVARERLQMAIARGGPLGAVQGTDAAPFVAHAHLLLGRIVTNELSRNVPENPVDSFQQAVHGQRSVANEHFSAAVNTGITGMFNCLMLERGRLDEQSAEVFANRLARGATGTDATLLRAMHQGYLAGAETNYQQAQSQGPGDERCRREVAAGLARIAQRRTGQPLPREWWR